MFSFSLNILGQFWSIPGVFLTPYLRIISTSKFYFKMSPSTPYPVTVISSNQPKPKTRQRT